MLDMFHVWYAVIYLSTAELKGMMCDGDQGNRSVMISHFSFIFITTILFHSVPLHSVPLHSVPLCSTPNTCFPYFPQLLLCIAPFGSSMLR